MAQTHQKQTKVHLAFWPLFWRLFCWSFVVFELLLAVRIAQFAIPVQQKIGGFIVYSFRVLFYATTTAIVTTLIAEFIVRLVIRPVAKAWYQPPSDETAASFHLDVREAALEIVPARRKIGRLWTVGILVRTDRRICFYPRAWDAEPFTLDLNEVVEVSTVAAPRMFLGFVQGIPPLLSLRSHANDAQLFAVSDPDSVRSSFCPKESALVSWIS